MTAPEPPSGPGPATPPGDAGRWAPPPPGWTPPPPRQPRPAPQQGSAPQAPAPQAPAPQYPPRPAPQFGQQPAYGPQHESQYGPSPEAYGPGDGHADQQPFELLPDRRGNGPGDAPRPRNRRHLAWTAAAVVVLLCAGLAVFLLRGASGKTTGAASAEEAVRGVIDGIAAQDVAKVLSVVNPDETRSLGSLIDVARKHLSESGVVSPSGVVEPWLHLSVSGVRLRSEKARDDITFVTVVGGHASATIDQQAMPKSIRPSNPRTRHSSADLGAQLSQAVIAVIKRGDRWYVSPTTTLLENLRRQLGLPAPDFTATGTLDGGSTTPQGAVTDLVGAIVHHDLHAAASLISAKEVPALGYYYNTFAGALMSGLDRVSGQVSNIDTDVQDMTDGLKKVVIRGVDVTGTSGSGTISAQYRSGCISSAQVNGTKCLPAGFTRLTGWHDPFVVVEQNGGKWQVSPVATVLEYARIFFADGSINALYRQIYAPFLAPITQTIRVGSSATVKLNEAGFAHVTIIGAPHTCLDYDTGHEAYVEPVHWNVESTCGYLSIPASGSLDAIVLRQSWDGGTVQVTLRPQ